MLLQPSQHRLMESYGARHVLTLRNVREVDFGNYSCAADNSLGRERGFIDVSGTGENIFLVFYAKVTEAKPFPRRKAKSLVKEEED